MKMLKNELGASTTMTSTVGSATNAVQNLVRSTQAVVGAVLQQPESPFAGLVGGQGAQELALAEVRPQRFGEVELGVGGLKEKEVREPQFSRGPDQQIRVGQGRGIEMGRQRALVDLVRGNRSRRDLAGDSRGGAGEVLAPAV